MFLGATISAPPTTNNPGSSSSSSGTSGENTKVATITTTGASSKIIHPAEDISLEEIRAKQSKYAKCIPTKITEGVMVPTSSAAVEVSFR